MPTRLPPLSDVARWGAGLLVLTAGWAAGRGVALGMDVAHAAASGFAVSGSIFLAVMVRRGEGLLGSGAR